MLRYRYDWHRSDEIAVLGLTGRKTDPKTNRGTQEWLSIPWLTFITLMDNHAILIDAVWKNAHLLVKSWNNEFASPGAYFGRKTNKNIGVAE